MGWFYNLLGYSFEWIVSNIYLPYKESRSRDNDRYLQKFHVSLPKLGQAGTDGRVSLQTLRDINAYCAKIPYKADPLMGFVDFYNHPEYSNYLIVNNLTTDCYDCDDVAVLAKALVDKCGANFSKSWVWNLIIRPDKQFTEAAFNHVICGVELWDGRNIFTVVIDTNSLANKDVFIFYGDKNQAKNEIIKKFSEMYKVTYSMLLDVKYPFL